MHGRPGLLPPKGTSVNLTLSATVRAFVLIRIHRPPARNHSLHSSVLLVYRMLNTWWLRRQRPTNLIQIAEGVSAALAIAGFGIAVTVRGPAACDDIDFVNI